jgi:chitinase
MSSRARWFAECPWAVALVSSIALGCSSAGSGGSATTTTGSGGSGGGATTTTGSGGSGGGATTSTGSGGAGVGGSSGVGGSGGGAVESGREYAPYFYSWGWGNPAYPFTSLVDLKAKSGLGAVTLAFVLSNGGCSPTTDIHDHAADIAAFVAAGGKVKASFGGANGTYLENACGDVASLAQAIESFVVATGVSDLDFDVEQAGAMTEEVNQRRSLALASVQSKLGVRVAFTLASFPRDKWDTPGGMSPASLGVVASALAAGVKLGRVNLMTMDFGPYFSDGKAMGDLAISALRDANTQLRGLIPGLDEEGAFALLGATPMIGKNDVASEVFSLQDAQILVSFAKEKKLGLLAFWAINRDQPGSGDLGLYSHAQSEAFAFHQVFAAALQ